MQMGSPCAEGEGALLDGDDIALDLGIELEGFAVFCEEGKFAHVLSKTVADGLVAVFGEALFGILLIDLFKRGGNKGLFEGFFVDKF